MATHSVVPVRWRMMRRLNRRVAVDALGRGRGPRGLVLLLTTTGRRSGQPRVTPLQYEDVDGVITVASARGPQADWFRNAERSPRVTVQLGQRIVEAEATPVVDPARVADFFQYRLRRRPVLFRLMLLSDGVPPWAGRRRLERFAAGKAVLELRTSSEAPRA